MPELLVPLVELRTQVGVLRKDQNDYLLPVEDGPGLLGVEEMPLLWGDHNFQGTFSPVTGGAASNLLS